LSWINPYAVRIGSALACALLTLGVGSLARAQDAPAIVPSAQILSVTISSGASSAIVDVRVQGTAQYQWHRLRDPDNRFWIDFTNAQLTALTRDDAEPDPLGGLRLRQITPSTVRLALALTGPKNVEVIPNVTGVRILVHAEDVGDNVARVGNGTIAAGVLSNAVSSATTGTSGANTTATDASQLEKTSRTTHVPADTSGPTAAQIAAMENGQANPNVSPSPVINPTPVPVGSATPNTDANANAGTDADANPGVADAATPPAAVPNPCTSGAILPADICPKTVASASSPPANWKFGPRSTYVATNPRLIVIDPGHGGSDRGAIHGALQEATVNLDMAKRLRDILVARGWQVQMTRTTDVDVYQPNDTAHEELQARVDVGNNAGARLFVSIHSNSFINATPHGTTTYYSKAMDVPLALAVQHDLAGSLGTTDDGIIKSKLYVTLHSNMPAILVETAFLSNPDDYAKLASSDWRQKVAEAIAAGITDYAGAPPQNPTR